MKILSKEIRREYIQRHVQETHGSSSLSKRLEVADKLFEQGIFVVLEHLVEKVNELTKELAELKGKPTEIQPKNKPTEQVAEVSKNTAEVSENINDEVVYESEDLQEETKKRGRKPLNK
jgi:hypothetical protein